MKVIENVRKNLEIKQAVQKILQELCVKLAGVVQFFISKRVYYMRHQILMKFIILSLKKHKILLQLLIQHGRPFFCRLEAFI
jgi:hypothetical protein